LGPQYDGCGELFVSGCDTPPVLGPAEHPLDEIALLLGLRLEGLHALLGRVVGYDGDGSLVDEELAQLFSVIGGVGQAETRTGKRLKP